MTTKEISAGLAMEPSAVEKHLTPTYAEPGVRNRLCLVISAYTTGS